MQIDIALLGIFMGIAFAAPPGAVTAETFRRGLRGGFPLAFGVQLGSLIGDATYALLAFAGLAAVAQDSFLQAALGAIGAMFLMYLAWTSLAGAQTPVTVVPQIEVGAEHRGAFLSGLALSLTNPWAIAFWLSLGGALVSLGLANASARQVAYFFAAFMAGSALWALILSFLIARLRRWIGPLVSRLISVACAVALGSFGLVAASHVIVSLVGTR